MPRYLELTEDELVEKLRRLQELARKALEIAHAKPYNHNKHERACATMIVEMNKLAKEGDVI